MYPYYYYSYETNNFRQWCKTAEKEVTLMLHWHYVVVNSIVLKNFL